jgi:hypothetical protein
MIVIVKIPVPYRETPFSMELHHPPICFVGGAVLEKMEFLHYYHRKKIRKGVIDH